MFNSSMMFNLWGLTCVLLFFKTCTSLPFVFETVLNTCSYNSLDSKLIFTSKVWKVEDGDIVIYYTLCGYLPEEICGANAAACLKDKEYNIIGKQFILGSHNSLKLISGNYCKANSAKKYTVTIKFECYQEMKETHLEKKSDCEYDIYMINPKCELINCVINVDNQLIDLRNLKGNYFVSSKDNTNFSIALCGAKQKCTENNSDISICKKDNDGIIPLSSFQNEKIIYNRQKNEIVYRGSYKGADGLKKFEMLLKCDWENTSGQIKYREVSTQGKRYKFIMESSYGCVKLPPECVAREASLIYNLTNLFNSNGYEVLNVQTGSSIFLNICGPLNFNQKLENSCSRSFSQVCELRDGNYINRGSIMSKFEVINDVVQVTYSNGMKCKEDPLQWYSTHIDFFCSKTNQGPSFVKTDGCDLFINWSSPHVCPTYNKSSCEHEPQEYHECSVKFQGIRYDLSPLKLYNNSYDIDDPKNKSIKYFFNVCGPVVDPEAPCMKNSMVVMKDMDQNNVKYRTKSLGKMDSISVVNEQIVITTLSGTYCGREGDFTSSLYLICDVKEEKPRLVKNTECTYQFEWRTPYGCLNKTYSSEKQCLIKSLSSDISLNFTESKQKSLKINIDKMNYVFDICKESYTECLTNHCEDLPLVKHLVSRNNTIFLEMILPKPCDSKSVINKVVFELACDEIQYNENFKLKEQINNCTLKLLLNTNLVCGREEYLVDHKDENEKYVVIDDDELKQEMENCSVTNHMTGYKINLNSLLLNISTDCPTVYFYEHNTSVVLIYPNNKICKKSTLDVKYEYKAVLRCSNQQLRKTEKIDCLEVYHLEGPEFCKLFEFSTLATLQSTSSNTVTVVCSIIGAIVFVVVCCFGFYKWKISLRKSSYLTVYEKDADM